MDVGSSALENLGVILFTKKGSLKFFIVSLFLVVASVWMSGCASKFLHYDKAEELKKNDELASQVKIVVPEALKADSAGAASADEKKEVTAEPITESTVGKKLKKKISHKTVKAGTKEAKGPIVHEPADVEPGEGFIGRQPIKNPFRVGEKVVHTVSYFKMSAGTLTMEILPFAQVNGRKSYQLRTEIKTSSLFSSFYSVDDFVDAMMDAETFVPSIFSLHVKESKQLREAQMLFDWSKNQATYWEKKVTDKSGEENKKLQWDILPYSQNVFSVAYYLRVFPWELGKEIKVRVSDAEKNMIFRATAIRKEKLSTSVGDFDTLVLEPKIELQGKYQPTGDNYIWISDDDRHYILRIESKIKIGTLVSEVTELKPGQP